MTFLPVRLADALWQRDPWHVWMNSFINFDVCIPVHNPSHPPQTFNLKDKLFKKKKPSDSGRQSCHCEGNDRLAEGHTLHINSVTDLSCLSENIPKPEWKLHFRKADEIFFSIAVNEGKMSKVCLPAVFPEEVSLQYSRGKALTITILSPRKFRKLVNISKLIFSLPWPES